MTRFRATRLLPVLFALLVPAGCVDPAGSDVEPVPGEVRAQRARWEAQGWDDYRFVVSRTCFCTEEATQPALVEVRDDRVAKVTSARTGRSLDPRLGFTVDELFARIVEAEREGTYASVRYHPERGYPVEAELGTLANDAGVRYSIEGVQAIR